MSASDFDPHQIYHTVVTAGEVWADKKAAYEALDDVSKSLLAEVTSDYLSECKSRTEAEGRALASKRYRDHLADVMAARRAWLLSEVKYKALVMLAELRRTQESTRRAEMRL